MIQYDTVVSWDSTLIDVEYTDTENALVKGLVEHAIKITTGAPAATAGYFIPGAIIQNAYDGTLYINTGTTAAPVWVLQDITDKVFTTKVSLTSAQILALYTTPIQLLPAPGAGLVYEILAVTGRINFLTAAYATHTELDIIDATTGNAIFKETSALLTATSTTVSEMPVNVNANAGVIKTANGAIKASVPVGNPATGGGSVDLYLTYKIVTL